jgi:hypothetical protein
MSKKPKSTKELLKKSLGEIRECLSESIPNINKHELIGIKFSRIGEVYHIENAPIPPVDSIGVQLENSFNEFMKNLNVNYGGVKLEGSMLIGTKDDMFLIGYNDYSRKGNKIKKSGYSIDGLL